MEHQMKHVDRRSQPLVVETFDSWSKDSPTLVTRGRIDWQSSAVAQFEPVVHHAAHLVVVEKQECVRIVALLAMKQLGQELTTASIFWMHAWIRLKVTLVAINILAFWVIVSNQFRLLLALAFFEK
jgi:hypothetical protein